MPGTRKLSKVSTLLLTILLTVACGPQKTTAQRTNTANTSGVDSVTHVLPAAPLLAKMNYCPSCIGAPTTSFEYQGTVYFAGSQTTADAQNQLNTLRAVIGPSGGSLNIAFTGSLSTETISWLGPQNVIHFTSVTRQ